MAQSAIEPFCLTLAARTDSRRCIRPPVCRCPLARERRVLGPQQLRQVRLIPENYNYQGLYYVWNNKIAMVSLGRNFTSVIIESQDLAQMQKAAFNFMWDSLTVK